MQPEFTSFTPKQIARFWKKVDKSGDCWVWIGNRYQTGYGQVTVNKRAYSAHRLSYLIAHGSLPEGLCVCHSCDNPPCVNPAHLWLGTNQENLLDRDRKGRTAKGDKSGARLHPDTLARGDRNGARLYPERMTRGDQSWTRKHPERLLRGDNHPSKTKPETVLRGERNGMAVLTDEKVREMKRLIEGKQTTLSHIASLYGVSLQTVWRIAHGYAWKHVR